MREIVYRVQDAIGRGPWRPGFSHLWVEDRPDHKHLLPWMQEFGHDAIPRTGRPFAEYFGCACRTIEQLRRWFTESEYATLRHYGFMAVKLQADRVLRESDIQLLFQRTRPLAYGAEPFGLYE